MQVTLQDRINEIIAAAYEASSLAAQSIDARPVDRKDATTRASKAADKVLELLTRLGDRVSSGDV